MLFLSCYFNTWSFQVWSASVLNISLSCPGLSYHYHPSKTRSWNLNPASYAICQGSWMMKGQREIYRRRRKGQREHHIIVHMAAAGGSKKKRLGAFFAFDEALESLVSIPSTHTALLFLMSTRGHRMNTSEHTHQCLDTSSGNANPRKWKYSG